MARRVNSKFLVFLLGASGLVVGGGAFGFYLRVRAHSADYRQLETQADEAITNGDLEKGATLLAQARDQVPDNTEVLVKLGDVLDRLTGKDPMHLGEARTQWNKAVSVDPHCVPALHALLRSYSDELDINPRPEVFAEVKRVSERLLNIVPTDLQAREKKEVAVIHEWLANQTASDQDVRESIETSLPELIRQDPDNAELPRTLALARLQQARNALNGDDKEAARFVLDRATTMLDAARKGREQNADLQYRAFQSYLKMKQIDPDVKTDKIREKGYDDRINQCLQAAMALASKMDPAKDPLCDDIHQSAAEWASQQGKPGEAEKIMRGFYEAHKNDQRARLTMARVLEAKEDAKSREEAAAILNLETAEDDGAGGFKALVQRDLVAQTVAELVKVHLADYSATPASDKARRSQLDASMQKEMDNLRHLYPPQSVPVLNLEGRTQLLKGENVEAVKTFERAALQMSPNSADAELPDLLYELAVAYTRTGQPGQARKRLEEVIAKLDSAAPPRVLLAQLLLQFNDLQGASLQLRKLQELAPESPEVKQLAASLTLANWRANEPAAVAVYNQMPETTRAERMTKAQVANAMGRADEAARLLELVVKEAPGDAQAVQASLLLAQVYTNNLGQKETAKRVIEDALKAHPDEPVLVDADARLHDLLPEDIYALVLKAVQQTADPFTREMQMFDLECRPGGHPEQAFGHLLEASKIKPDDVKVLDYMFSYYINKGKADLAAADVASRQADPDGAQAAKNTGQTAFDTAAKYVDRLAAQNADQCGGLMYRYRLALLRGDLPAAEDQGHQLTQHYPEFAASWLVTAQVLQLRGKFDEAVRDFLEVLNRQPGQYDAYRGLIECYFRINQPDNAEIRLREARMHYPNDPVLREQLLVYLVNFGKAIEAVPEREQMLANDKQRQKDTADDYLQLAKAYFHAAQDEAVARPDDSADHLNKAFQTLAKGKDKFPEEGRFSSQLAEMYQYNRDLVSGEKVLKELYDRDDLKNDPEPALLLADFYTRSAKLAMAEDYLGIALSRAERKRDANGLDIRLRLASLQAQEGKFAAAYATLNGAGSISKTDPSLIRQRLEIMIAEGRTEEARKGLEAELAKRDGADLHILLASLLIDARELDEALKHTDHVLTIDPRNDAAIYLQSLAVARQNNIPRAIDQLIAVRNRDPRNAQVRMLLGELYSKSGKTDFAIRELEEALQKIPTSRDIRLSLIQLYRGQHPLTRDALDNVVRLCVAAEADPVLHIDPGWPREEALAYAAMTPPDVPRTVLKWQAVIALAPDNLDYRREFVDLLIQFHDWSAVMNETDKLVKEGRDTWWLHYQRGMAMAHLGQKEKAVIEFDAALKVNDLEKARALAGADSPKKSADVKSLLDQSEFIIRGFGENCGHKLALDHVSPLLANDPEGRWRLLQASELRALGELQRAETIVDALLADPLSKPAERRLPLLRAEADICQAHSVADAKDSGAALAEDLKARNAYLELLNLTPEDIMALNNVAYLIAEKIPAPEGGPLKAKVYSSKAYDLVRFRHDTNVMVVDTQGWVLTLCGGDDAIEGLGILQKMLEEREDTRTFIEGRYHLGEAYLRAAKPNPAVAEKWLKEAMNLIGNEEKDGQTVDPVLKDKVQTALAKATSPVTSGR